MVKCAKEQTTVVMATVIVVITCIILVCLAEGAVRLRQWLKHGYVWGIEQIMVLDPSTGLRLPLAGAEIGPISINALAFRGPEIVQPKPPRTLRLAFIGASTTFCAEVSSNELVWTHLLSQALRREFQSVGFDYVNAGVPGFTVKSSLKNLKLRVAFLEPDVIVIYHAANDLSNNALGLALDQGIIEPKGEHDSSRLMAWLLENSIVVNLAEKNLRILFRQHALSDPVQQEATGPIKKLNFDAEVLARPYRKDLQALVEESQRHAKLVVLMTFSQRLRPDQSAEEQRDAAVTHVYYFPYFSRGDLINGFALYNGVIRDVAKEYDALLIAGEDDIPGDGVHFADSVHFSDAGSRAMAERVTGALLVSDRFRALVENISRK